MRNDIFHLHLTAMLWGLNAWPRCVYTKIQTTAVSWLCTLNCSWTIYDLIRIIHADILHSNTVLNHSLPKRLWAITSEHITAAVLCEAEIYLKHIWRDLPLGYNAKKWKKDTHSHTCWKQAVCKKKSRDMEMQTFPDTFSRTEALQSMQLKRHVWAFDGWAVVDYLRVM